MLPKHHLMNMYDHPCTIDLIESIESTNGISMVVLDVGCGDGRDLNYLMEIGFVRIGFGIDDHHTPKIYSNFTRKFRDIFFMKMDVLVALQSFAELSFDFIFFNNSLEHFEFPEVVVDECHRVCVSGGFIYCTLPFEKYHNDPDHKNYYDIESLTKLFARKFHVLKCNRIDGNNMSIFCKKEEL